MGRRTSTGNTPFTLTYGHKAEELVEVGRTTYKIQHFDQDSTNASLEEVLNLLEERRLEVELRTSVNKRRPERCFNQQV